MEDTLELEDMRVLLPEPGKGVEHMVFTTDWVTCRIPWWNSLIADYKDGPVSMLEVGFYEGRSAKWWLQNLLTHPASKLESVESNRVRGAVNRSHIMGDPDFRNKFAYYEEDAIKWAAHMTDKGMVECYDFIYSDFSKEASDILTLACLAWRMLKPGGLYLFDDYLWEWFETSTVKKPSLLPKAGIDAFLSIHAPSIESVRYEPMQVAVKKRK